MNIDMNSILIGTVKLITDVSVSAVVKEVVSNALPDEIKPVDKFIIGIGTMVISGMICDQANKYVVEKFHLYPTTKETKVVVPEIPTQK